MRTAEKMAAMTDEALIYLLRDIGVGERFARTVELAELIRRYEIVKSDLGKVRDELENKKKECEKLEQELKGWKRYESHYQPF
jgi:archaellum component FlaC